MLDTHFYLHYAHVVDMCTVGHPCPLGFSHCILNETPRHPSISIGARNCNTWEPVVRTMISASDKHVRTIEYENAVVVLCTVLILGGTANSRFKELFEPQF